LELFVLPVTCMQTDRQTESNENIISAVTEFT